MNDLSKENRILDAATLEIAENGYANATMARIAKRANVSSGLIYFYFPKGKLQVLLSITVRFWKILNERLENQLASISDPVARITELARLAEFMLVRDNNRLYLAKVLIEELPRLFMISDDELKDTRMEITVENRKFINTIDTIIRDGQNQGVFDGSLKPSAMRQVLYGATEMLLYGLFIKASRNEDLGYGKADVKKTLDSLIRKFLCKNP
ncbi:MAG: TetR/AcrR family transcriptional regulator [Desulfatibacillum sp.]|nr:TetR/AcrR family transcriptional regulator [Desulfatibacillum sp.]